MTYEEKIKYLNSYAIEDKTKEDEEFVFTFDCQERLISELLERKGRMRGNKNETTFDDYLKEQLKDPEFRKEWEKLRDEDMQKEGAE